jgi:hypothetical protein
MKALKQMDKACDNPDTQIMHQGDTRLISKLENMEVSGTSHRADSATFLASTNLALNETWGNFCLYSPLQGKRCFVVLVNLFGHSLKLVLQFFSP